MNGDGDIGEKQGCMKMRVYTKGLTNVNGVGKPYEQKFILTMSL